MAAWRLAYSLEQLRNEVNARWPNRNKASDGTIGDPAHAATASDHNPNAAGVVCALDITNDPVNGPTAQYLFDMIQANPQVDAKYIIANRQIASKTHGWTVRSYSGSDPHTSHIHVSVGVGSDGQSQQPYDDRNQWLYFAPKPVPELKDMPVEFLLVSKGAQYLVDTTSGFFGVNSNQSNPPIPVIDMGSDPNNFVTVCESMCANVRQGK